LYAVPEAPAPAISEEEGLKMADAGPRPWGWCSKRCGVLSVTALAQRACCAEMLATTAFSARHVLR